MNLVVDNSVVMRWIFSDGTAADSAYASKVAALIETTEVVVPALFVTEAANVLARGLKLKIISRAELMEHFELIDAMQARVVPPHAMGDIRRLTVSALEEGLSAYDASYLLLAESLACPLATLDKDLRKVAKRRGVSIACLP